jgi:hypothetical protein
MSDAPEQPFPALRRLAQAAGGLDIRTAEIVVCHAAIEKEVNLALAKRVANPERLGTLNLVHSLKMLAAVWTSSQSKPLADLLVQWDELRNHVAHGRTASEVPARLQRLKQAALAMGVSEVTEDSITIPGLAAFTCHLLSTGGQHEGLVHLLQLPLDALTTKGRPVVAILSDQDGEMVRNPIPPDGSLFLIAPRDGRGPCRVELVLSNGEVQATTMNTTSIARNDTVALITVLPASENELLTIR